MVNLQIETPSAKSPLLFSMKGFEVYVWDEVNKSEVEFALVAGTNRPKTRQEIINSYNPVEELSYRIRGRGAVDLRKALARLPVNTTLTWKELPDA